MANFLFEKKYYSSIEKVRPCTQLGQSAERFGDFRSACLVPRLLGQPAEDRSGRRASEHLDAATASGVRMSPVAVACIPHLGL